MSLPDPESLDRLGVLVAAPGRGRTLELCRALSEEMPAIRTIALENLAESINHLGRKPHWTTLWWAEELDASSLYQAESWAAQCPWAALVVAAARPGDMAPEKFILAGAQFCLDHDPPPGELVKALRWAAARSLAVTHHWAEGRLYRSIVFRQHELICRFTGAGQLTFMNPAFRRYFGLPSDAPPRGSFFQHVVEDDRREFTGQLASLEPQNPMTRLEVRVRVDPEGGARWLRWSVSAIYDKAGAVREYQAVGQDVTQGKYLEEALQVAEANLRQLIISNADGMVVTDQGGTVLFVNPAAERLLGCGSFDLLDRPFAFPLIPGQRQELRLGPDGESQMVAEMRVVETKWRRAKAYLATLRDISELKKLQDELREMSLVDPLTGLYNRRGFTTLARQQLKTAQRMGRRMLLFFMDLDGLKAINDNLGHGQGDRAIREAAMVLKATFRESDILGRWGGDEFCVLAMETDEDGSKAVMRRLELNLGDWNTDAERPYKLSLSTGAAGYDPERPSALEDLLSQADQRMYEFKRGRRAPGKKAPSLSRLRRRG